MISEDLRRKRSPLTTLSEAAFGLAMRASVALGVITLIVLGFSRAIGETMIVLVAAGGTPTLSFDPSEPMQTMTAFIAAAGIGDQPTGSTGYKTIFAVGATLFTVTFFLDRKSVV